MCIAIAHRKNATKIKKEDFFTMHTNNPHGFGMLTAPTNKNTLRVYKSMNINKGWERYNNWMDKYNKESPVLVHFRLSTGGKHNIDNCHPFICNSKVGFIHNGYIHNTPGNTEFSDTYMFNKSVLSHLNENFLKNDQTIELINKYIGNYNKIIFLTTDREVCIFNEEAGSWDKDKRTWSSQKTAYNSYSGYGSYSGVVSKNFECVKCKKYFTREEVYVICTNRSFSKNLCIHCLKEDTKISDIIYVPSDFSSRMR